MSYASVSVRPWPASPAATDPDAGPVLFLVAASAPPPPIAGPLHDWIRLPADQEDVERRIDVLGRRAGLDDRPVVRIEDEQVLRVGARRIILSPLEARLVASLLARPGQVVPRSVLEAEQWGDGEHHDVALLDKRVKVLRKRLAGCPLRLHTVRGRGFLLEVGVGTHRVSPDVYLAS